MTSPSAAHRLLAHKDLIGVATVAALLPHTCIRTVCKAGSGTAAWMAVWHKPCTGSAPLWTTDDGLSFCADLLCVLAESDNPPCGTLHQCSGQAYYVWILFMFEWLHSIGGHTSIYWSFDFAFVEQDVKGSVPFLVYMFCWHTQAS